MFANNDLEAPHLPPTSPTTKKDDDITEELPKETSGERAKSPEITPTAAAATVYKPIIIVAVILLCVYLTFGVITYTSLREEFTGTKTTNRFVDALYFAIVTLSTVGYGDIVPSSTKTKILTIVLVSIGGLSLYYLMNRVAIHLLDLQEKTILASIKTPSLIVDDVKARIRTGLKMCLAMLAVVLCVGVGTLFLHYREKLDLMDSVYLSVISIATVGYGDKSFQTVSGRVFAVVWILISSLAVTTFFYYFAETKIGGSIMQLPESMRMDKAEFILLKLKEAEKITEEDISLILEGYDTRDLDSNRSSTLTS